jgi:hypothetical protein
MASILNKAASSVAPSASITPFAFTPPNIQSGSIQANSAFTLVDTSSTQTTGSANLAKSYNNTARPVTVPGPNDGNAWVTALNQTYASRAGRKALGGVDATGTVLAYSAFTDALCNQTVLRRLIALEVTNQGPEPITVSCVEVASGDIKIPVGGTFLFVVPMDGVAATGTGITVKCASAGKTSDVIVVTAYQGE